MEDTAAGSGDHWNTPDPEKPGYSLMEYDLYANRPNSTEWDMRLRGHRQSIRKNLNTGQFEVYRFYYLEKRDEVIQSFPDFESAKAWGDRDFNEAWNGKGAKPWKGVCCQACWYAKKKPCRCKCRRAHHQEGVPGARAPGQDSIQLAEHSAALAQEAN